MAVYMFTTTLGPLGCACLMPRIVTTSPGCQAKASTNSQGTFGPNANVQGGWQLVLWTWKVPGT